MAEGDIYYGTYCRLDTESGDSEVIVDGNATAIGLELTITPQLHVTERGKEVPRMVLNRGDMAMGFLPENVYRQVARLQEAGWICRAFTSASAFVKSTDSYWVEAAIICYQPDQADSFGPFVEATAKRIAKGEHPAVALSPKEQSLVVESKGAWCDTKEQKLPKLKKGSAYYKTKRTMTESMAYAAAEGNKGCWVGLFAVVFVIVFGIIWFLFLR